MASLKAAIRQKCRDCTYDPCAAGTYLQQIESCTVKSCALWAVRPVSVQTLQLRRSEKAAAGVDINALVAGLPSLEEDFA